MKESESEFLLRHGWKLMSTVGFGRGRTKYWHHPKYLREDGLWWSQSAAYVQQRKINREEGKKANA